MDDTGKRVVQAREVYVLMKKDYRISRNIRAQWFFEHLNTQFLFKPQEHIVDTDEELQVVSVVAGDGSQFIPGNQYQISLLPSTMVMFVARRYRFVIILDLSPSISSVDLKKGTMLFDEVYKTLSNFLKGLVKPFKLPGCFATLSPEIHATIMCYTTLKTFNHNQVLVQGLVATSQNVDSILSRMGEKLAAFESALAANFKEYLTNNSSNFASSYYDIRPPMSSPVLSHQISKDSDVNNPEAGIVNMIRNGMMALQLLPENSSAGLVVVTDGCLGVPDTNLFEFLLTQLRTSTIACSFLCLGEDLSPFGHFGHIPHVELMQFIATATFGSYFDNCPDVSQMESNSLNVYHKAMFLWSFQRGLEGFRFDLGDHLITQQASPSQLVQKLLSHPIHGKLASVMSNVRKSHSKCDLKASLFSVMSVRLREGYTIREIALTKGESQLEVKMVLPYREYARFEYVIRAPWPFDKNRPLCFIEITLEGSYDFLHDMICTKIMANMSSFRQANVKKFWLALQGLSQTDCLLVHLQSFASNPVHYTMPASIKEGVPLYYLPTNSVTPMLNTQLNVKDSALNQFASYWRPVVNFDIKVWQKWMHTHRIGLVLEHDMPVHKNVHIPNSSSRFLVVMYRQALTSLTLFLTSWSDFVLLDGQAYIKLIKEDNTKPPTSFVLIRMQTKSPCLVLRLAFLGGTPGFVRHGIIKELKMKVASLKFPPRGQKSDKHRQEKKSPTDGEPRTPKKPPLRREWSEIQCCVLLQKPVETILIRSLIYMFMSFLCMSVGHDIQISLYERVPHDMSKLEDQVMQEVSQFVPHATQAKNKSAANLFNSLARYLMHQRWVWTIQQPGMSSISMQSIGKLLATLAKIRLQEGFHYSLTGQGIVNMMVEVEMRDSDVDTVDHGRSKQRPTCVVQYIMFPPHLKTAHECFSDDEEEMEGPEEDGELQIVTECWVEPQSGHCVHNPQERQHWDGITCTQILDTFFPLDLECISSLITFEHLLYLCQNSVIPADLDTIVNVRNDVCDIVSQVASTIKHVAFPFRLLSLLPRSQQAELLYSAYTFDAYHRMDANNMFYTLIHEELASGSHRKVCLKQHQSKLFIKHLLQRQRSKESYPFPCDFDNFLDVANENATPVKTDQSDSDSSKDKLNQSQQRTQPQDKSRSQTKVEPIVFPEWMCYLRNSANNSLLITIVPSTFEDVVLLHKGGKRKAAPETESETDHPHKESASQVVQVNKLDKAVNATEETLSTCNNKTDHAPDNILDTEQLSPEAVDSIDGVTGVKKAKSKLKLRIPQASVQSKPLSIPVYIYECVTHNILDSLIHARDFKLPPDIFQDMTFDLVSEHSDISMNASPRVLKRVSFSVDSIKEGEESSYRLSSWRSNERRSTEGSSNGEEDLLWQQCSFISETFFSTFVKGVYLSLQKGYTVHSHDVDAAINQICEESIPLEANMTSFLHASCGHFQHLVNEARKDQERSHDDACTQIADDFRSPSIVRFMEVQDEASDLPGDQGQQMLSVLEIPKMTWKLDLPSLHLDMQCKTQQNLHNLVQRKFQDIVGRWFRPVPSDPEYYFYCPEPEVEEMSEDKITSDTAVGPVSNRNFPHDSSDNNLVTMDTLAVKHHDDRASLISNLDSEESMESDISCDLDMTVDDKSDQMPLFIFFTCTIKSRLQTESLPLRNLAVCLNELSAILEKMKNLELGDLKITFDLNCLTLPTDVDTPSFQRPTMRRMFSYTSAGGGSDTGSEHEEMATFTDRSSFSFMDLKHLRNPIGHLPQRQHDAITKCLEEVKWLLQDEIASNLRNISPILPDTLTYVSKHIQTSNTLGKANVNLDSVPLQFVFGPDQSRQIFIEEFQKMNLHNYQLTREDGRYFLSKKRIMAFSYMNANSLCSALDEINHWDSKASAVSKVCSPSSGPKSETSENIEAKGTKNINPLVKENVFDVTKESMGRSTSSPLTVNSGGKTDETIVSLPRRHNKECLTLEKKQATGYVSLENVGLLQRRKDLGILKLKGYQDVVGANEKKSSTDGVSEACAGMNGSVAEAEVGEVNHVSINGNQEQETPGVNEIKGNDSPVSGHKAETSVFNFPVSTASYVSPVSSSIYAESHVTSANQSPVCSEVSIKLTKTDGRCEPFRTSPERLCNENIVNKSFDNVEEGQESILKRCSSFAGFRSKEICCAVTEEEKSLISHECSPEKGLMYGPSAIGRLRHCSAPLSGHGTPRSRMSTQPHTPSGISSRGSLFEYDYDGDMSEMDDSATTFSGSRSVQRLMPDFWLIMQINQDSVDIHFQHRETGKETNEETLEFRELLATMKTNVGKICRRVNQQLLLNSLNDTRMCHNLLVDAADEDVSWKVEGQRYKRNHTTSNSENEDDEDEEDDSGDRKYLAVAMELDPGHFDCECVWKTLFCIHPGLKRGTRTGSLMSIGVKTLRSVLKPFSVNNRNNMFVMKETDTGNVFYLRLKELPSDVRLSVASEEATTTQAGVRAASVGPGPQSETAGVKDRDGDNISLTSYSSMPSLLPCFGKGAISDCVELSVHGIDEVGTQIKEHLVQMLQNRLDDAALEKVLEMLRRNPQCQLDRYDVQFIQKPLSEPACKLHLMVSNKASPQLAAVMFYLRQNLLQFLHTPKYKSASDEVHFMDMIDGDLCSIPADQAFLYIPLLTARKTGIAVLSISLVDGHGNQVKLLQSSRPSCLSYLDLECQSDLEAFVQVQSYEVNPHSKRPGPTALVQFHIWVNGDVCLKTLQEKLTQTLKHALCDVVMEYHVLTAPLCTIPKHMLDLVASSPTMSAPCSPFYSMPGEDSGERKLTLSQTKSAGPHASLSRRSSLQNVTRFQAIKEVITQSSKKRVASPALDANKTFDLAGVDSGPTSRSGSPAVGVGSPRARDRLHLITPYEKGDQGTLNHIYADLLEAWFLFCLQLETPAVNKHMAHLHSRFAIDATLTEFQQIVVRLCPSVTTKVYKILPQEEEDENTNIGMLYDAAKYGGRRSVASYDTGLRLNISPGADLHFISVCRDIRQWYNFVQHNLDEEDHESYIDTLAKGKVTSQRFSPHIPCSSEGKTFGMFTDSPSIIPRQKFLLLIVRNNDIIMYGYNWSNELFTNLCKQLTKLEKWSNARSQLLSSVAMQKCGLFNHYMYADASHNMDKSETLDQLIRNPAPPPPSKEKLSRTQSVSSTRDSYLPFEKTFMNVCPFRPVHMSDLKYYTDPVQQYGQQVMDIRVQQKKHFDKIDNIQKLFMMWLQKTGTNLHIATHVMQTLKQSSYLFHYCATPLMFSCAWRRHVLRKFSVMHQDSVVSSTPTPEAKSRSRHGSGASTNSQSLRTKRTDSNELKKRPSYQALQSASTEDSNVEEEWHVKLRALFVHQYINYLKTIGFQYVQMEKAVDKSKVMKKSAPEGSSDPPPGDEVEIKPTDTHNLQKTISGGVLLVEISFRNEYFCVKLYTCDHNKLGITVNQQNNDQAEHSVSYDSLNLLFVDECEKVKEMIHVHSFAHDFHLRCIQSYIGGQRDLFKQDYFLSGLLNDFVKVYPYAPSFSRNFLQREVISIPDPSCSSAELYEYMLTHAEFHAMGRLKMKLPHDTYPDHRSHEYALISHETRDLDPADTGDGPKSLVAGAQSYNLGLIILQDMPSKPGPSIGATGPAGVSPGEKPALLLQYYIILTSSQLMFPRQTLDREGSVVMPRSNNLGYPVIVHSLKTQLAGQKSLSANTTNYLGWFNKHQPPMYRLLMKEAAVVRSKIEAMAVVSMGKCRRDLLWTKMLVSVQDELHKKKQDDKYGPLTYTEFKEMLESVNRIPLSALDDRLVPFQQMSHAWYLGLVHVLQTHYTDQQKRCFINPTNTSEQHHIIVHPKFLELFMMLSLDASGGKTGLYAVFRKPAKETESICPGGQAVPEHGVHVQMEQFINTCCFHMWNSML